MEEIKFISDIPDKALKILIEAMEFELSRLQYNVRLSKQRLEKFEKKYNISSEIFIKNWSAEDLEGKDFEYVEWAGEYRLALSLNERLKALKSIQHVDS